MAEYLQIAAGSTLPEITVSAPYKAILVAETKVTAEWQALLSEWLVDSGCLYMLASGEECSAWDDAVDLATVLRYQGEVPDEAFVMTTWHESESLQEVFFFAKNGGISSVRCIDSHAYSAYWNSRNAGGVFAFV